LKAEPKAKAQPEKTGSFCLAYCTVRDSAIGQAEPKDGTFPLLPERGKGLALSEVVRVKSGMLHETDSLIPDLGRG